MNDRFTIIEYIFKQNNKDIEKNEDNLNKSVKSWESFERQIRDQKFKKMPRNDKLLLGKYFNDEKNKEILLKIFSEEQYEFFKKENKGFEKKKDIDYTELKEVLNYYKGYLFESKKEDIKRIEKIMENNEVDYKEYLIDLEKAKNMNIRLGIIKSIYELKYKDEEKKEENMRSCIDIWSDIEKSIKDKKIKKIRKDIKGILIKYFNDESKNILLQIFKEDEIDNFIKESMAKEKKENIVNKENIDKLKVVLDYYKNYKFSSKKDDIILIEKIIENGVGTDYDKYLNDFDNAKKMNDRFDIVEYIFKENNKNIEKNETEINKIYQNWIGLEKQIKDQKTKKMPNNYKLLLGIYFNDENNKKLLLKIFKENEYEKFKKESNEKKKKKIFEKDNIEEIEKYKEKENDENINKLKELLNYYKNYKFSSKKDDILKIEKTIENEGVGKIDEQYLKDFEDAKKMNDRINVIEYIFKEDNKNIEKDEVNFSKSVVKWQSYEKQIADKEFKEMPENAKLLLGKYFNDKNNKKILLKIFDENIYNFFKNEYKNQDKKKNHEDQKDEKNNVEIQKLKNDIINGKSQNIEKEIMAKLKEILNYYKKFLFISKKDDINSIEKAFEDNDISKIKYDDYFKDLDIARKMNDREGIIYYIFKSTDKWKNEEITEENISEVEVIWENLEKIINDKKLKKMRREYKNSLYNFFKDDNNKNSLQKIFEKDIITNFINEVSKIKNLTSILIFYKNYKFESKKHEIDIIKQFIEDQEIEINIDEYIKDLERAKKLNDRYDIINYIFNSKNKKEINKTEKEFEQYIKMWEFFEERINNKKLNNIYLRDKHIIYDFFNNSENKISKSKIFKNESYQFFVDDFNNIRNKRSSFF